MTESLAHSTAQELLQGYRSGGPSPVDAVDATLARIDALNPKLNAFMLVDHAGARSAAEASAKRWKTGDTLGPLDGVPVTIKDIILTEGWPTLRGSKTTDPHGPWTEDAPCTARLKEAGAIVLGKTTTPEFGWKGVTDSPLSGITRNPWNLERTPGGSSGGAGAAAAAGMGALHIGTDGGGSIRIPASFCGIVGHKPSFGRVPAYPLSPYGTIAHVGPMTRSVYDAALMLSVISAPDSRDCYVLPDSQQDFTQGLDAGIEGLRVAYSATLGGKRVDPEVADLTAKAARRFEELGAIVEEADPGLERYAEVFATLWFAGAGKVVAGIPADKHALLDPGFLEIAQLGQQIGLHAYLDAAKLREAITVAMCRFHESYDLLLTPALSLTAFPVGMPAPHHEGGAQWVDWTPFSLPFNLTQQPAASMPCGLSSEGLPVGLQIVGPRYRDDLVLRAARAFETISPVVLPQIA
ncbi:MAG: amidase [Rhodovibrionaceae bacterium]